MAPKKTQNEKMQDAFNKAVKRIEEKAKQQALKEKQKEEKQKAKQTVKKMQTREKMEALGEEAERQAFARPNNLSTVDPFEFLQSNRPAATRGLRAQAKKRAAQLASREATRALIERMQSDDFVPQPLPLPAISKEKFRQWQKAIKIIEEEKNKTSGKQIAFNLLFDGPDQQIHLSKLIKKLYRDDDKFKPLILDKNNRWRTASGYLASKARLAEEERQLDLLAHLNTKKKLPKLTVSKKLDKNHTFAYKADFRGVRFKSGLNNSFSHVGGDPGNRWSETVSEKRKQRRSLKNFFASRKIVPSDENTEELMWDLPYLWFAYEMGIYADGESKADLEIIGVRVIPVVDLTLPIIQTPLYGVLTYQLENQESAKPTNDCIPQAIESIMKKNTPKDLLKQLNIKTRQDGVTAEKLIDFCENNNIQLGLCDIAYNVLYLGNPQKLTLYGIIQTDTINGEQKGHLYRVIDQAVIKMIFTPCQKQNVKQPRKLTCKECNISYKSSFQHSEHMLQHSKLDIVYCEDIMEEAKRYINMTGTIPRFSVNGQQFFTKTTRHVERVPHGFMYKGEKYQSITRFATSILSDLYNDEYLSTLNQTTQNIFDQSTTPCVMPRKEAGTSYEYDITRCYTSILYNYEMPVFSIQDEPQLFTGDIKNGAFYGVLLDGVENKAVTWLIGDLVLLYLSKGSSCIEDVKYQLVPHKTLCFKNYVNFILKNEDLSDGEKKETINNLIGALSHSKHTTKHRPIITASSSDFTHVCQHADQNNIKCESFVLQWPDIMLNMLSDQTEKNINARPMWHFIVQTSRLLMEKAAHYITQQGGTVDEINTDAIYTAEPNELPDLFVFEDPSPGDAPAAATPGKWKPVKKVFKPAGKKYTQKPAPITYDVAAGTPCDPWVTLTQLSDQKGALITGAPGTGKSTLWREFKKHILKTQTITKAIKANKDNLAVKKGETYYKTKTISNVAELSFQNNVVANIGPQAQTFHKVFKLDKQSKHAGCLLNKAFKDVKYIFIDEIQQTPDNVIPWLIWLKDNLNIKFYCAGDFDQWLSINNPFTEDANWLKYITDNNKLTLTVNHRNPDMHNIHDWMLTKTESLPATKYHICYTNKEVYNINEALYKEFEKKDNEIPFVCCRGNKLLGLIKGRHYLLVDRILKLDPAFHTDVFQINYTPELGPYFTLGYAFTCHKTIGLTITAEYTIHQLISKKYNDVKQRYNYVARSRAVDQKNIFEADYIKVFDQYSLDYC